VAAALLLALIGSRPEHLAPAPERPAVSRETKPQIDANVNDAAIHEHHAETHHIHAAPHETPAPRESLSDWLAEWRANPSEDLLDKGRELAEIRRARMQHWIRHDPQRAADNRLRFQEYRDLPPAIAAMIERPIAARADILATPPFCQLNARHTAHAGHDHEPGEGLLHHARIDGEVVRIFPPASRQNLISQNDMPLAGLRLDDAVALLPDPSVNLSSNESEAAKQVLAIDDRRAAPSAGLWVGDSLVEAGLPGEDILGACLREAEGAMGEHAAGATLELYESGGLTPAAFDALIEAIETSWSRTPKDVLFIRANLADRSGVEDASSVRRKIEECSDLIRDMSYGASYFSRITVTSQAFQLPRASYQYTADYYALYFDALDAAEANGYSVDAYDIVGVVFPEINFRWIGLASVNAGRQWINGNWSSEVYLHEFGHNFGLPHAYSWDANDGSIVPGPGQSQTRYDEEYGDIYDVMGSGPTHGEYHAYAKDRLHWLPETKIQRVTSGSRRIRIHRIDAPSALTNPTLAVRAQSSQSEPFWISHRRNFTTNSSMSNGAYIIWEFNEQIAKLLDMTPDSSPSDRFDKEDAALQVGDSFSDPTNTIHVTVAGRGGFGASAYIDVDIVVGGRTNAPPTVRFNPPEEIVVEEQARFFATGSDPDGDRLTYEWNWGDGTTGAGNPASHTFQRAGSFGVSVTATDPSGASASAFQNIVVSERLADWQSVHSGTDVVLYDVAHHQGRFLAAGGSYILRSLDGISWKQSFLPLFSARAIGARDDAIRVVGEHYSQGWNGGVVVSDDGIEWTLEPVPPGLPRLNGVACGDNLWVAVGDGGVIIRKEAGGLWTEATTPGGGARLNDVVFYNGQFWAAGDRNTLLRSADGDTWEDRSASSRFDDDEDIEDLAVTGDQMYLAGEAITLTQNGGVSFYPLQPPVDGYRYYGIVKAYSEVFAAGRIYDPASGGWREADFVRTRLGQHRSLPVPGARFRYAAAAGAGRYITAGSGGEIRISEPKTESEPPTGELNGPSQGFTREVIEFTFDATDPEGAPLNYFWDFGDGNLRPGEATWTNTFDIPGRYRVRAVANDQDGNAVTQTKFIEIERSTTSNVITWLESYLADPGDLLLTADPDEDNRTNLLEYALNSNPAKNDGPAVLFTKDGANEDGNWTIPLRMNDPSLTCRVNVSTNLTDWTPMLIYFDPDQDTWRTSHPDQLAITEAVEQTPGVWTFTLEDVSPAGIVFMTISATYLEI